MDNRINVLVHFVWATWDRLPIIRPEIERPVYRYIHAACEQLSCPVVALGGAEDHIHLLVSLPATRLMADLMEVVKGRSSRLVSQELLNGDWFQWQGSYGAFSVSPADKARVIAYIRRQKERHAIGKVWPNAERSSDFRDRPATAVHDTAVEAYDASVNVDFDVWYDAFLALPMNETPEDDADPFEFRFA